MGEIKFYYNLLRITGTLHEDQRTFQRYLVELYLGKAIPLQVWLGPDGSSKLSFQDFMTTAQVGDKVVSLTYRPLLPLGNTPPTLFF